MKNKETKRVTAIVEKWESRQECIDRVMRDNKITEDDLQSGRIILNILGNGKTSIKS